MVQDACAGAKLLLHASNGFLDTVLQAVKTEPKHSPQDNSLLVHAAIGRHSARCTLPVAIEQSNQGCIETAWKTAWRR
eukprot:scaffold185805_cov19-Tisochrysis_lutea.AAC.1